MLAPTATSRLLFATPPALRSEIVRRTFRASAAARLLCQEAGGRHIRVRRSGRAWSRGALYLKTGAVRYLSSGPNDTGTAPASKPEHTTSSPPLSRSHKFFVTTSLIFIFFSIGFAMAAAPAVETITGWVKPPTDEETLVLYQPTTPEAAEINEKIITHPLAVKLRAREGVSESRPHMKIPLGMRPHNLTGGTLLGEGKIEVPPLTFNEKHQNLPSLVQLSYLGPALCGHPGIVHGGLLATMLDEGLARACFPALPNKVGVTASLKIDYRVPCPANSYVVLKAQTTKVEGRKAWVKGWIELLGEDDSEGTKLVEAEALFIEPKGAAQMAKVYSTQ